MSDKLLPLFVSEDTLFYKSISEPGIYGRFSEHPLTFISLSLISSISCGKHIAIAACCVSVHHVFHYILIANDEVCRKDVGFYFKFRAHIIKSVSLEGGNRMMPVQEVMAELKKENYLLHVFVKREVFVFYIDLFSIIMKHDLYLIMFIKIHFIIFIFFNDFKLFWRI